MFAGSEGEEDEPAVATTLYGPNLGPNLTIRTVEPGYYFSRKNSPQIVRVTSVRGLQVTLTLHLQRYAGVSGPRSGEWGTHPHCGIRTRYI